MPGQSLQYRCPNCVEREPQVERDSAAEEGKQRLG